MKTLSPAELAKLEHAFAADPSSDAYKPLAEAYLGMGRFMEAMVVCKKGVKAHPNARRPPPPARPRLRRAGQGQEGARGGARRPPGRSPPTRPSLRMVGVLQLKTGEADARQGQPPEGLGGGPERPGDARASCSSTRWSPRSPPRPRPAPVPVAGRAAWLRRPRPPRPPRSRRRPGPRPCGSVASPTRARGPRRRLRDPPDPAGTRRRARSPPAPRRPVVVER